MKVGLCGADIVPTNVDYTYEIMKRNICELKVRYPFIKVGIAGYSVLGRKLYYLRLGKGKNRVFYNGAHHANEWIGSPLLMKFVENFAKAYSINGCIRGYNIGDIWNHISIYIMPMVNPDGVDLVINGLNPCNPYYKCILEWNKTHLPLSEVWKANIRGVDLNLNYPACWECEKEYEETVLGVTGPAPRDYGGCMPLSEPETIAVANFTRMLDFRLVIAYHAQGEVIYWQYLNLAPPEALEIAKAFGELSGYTVELNPPEASWAGYKDWFIQDYGRPGYTIEIGKGVNPVPISQFDTIYEQNEEILLLAATV